MSMDLSYFQDYHKKVIDNCSKVIVGKEDMISLVLTCFVCSGHVLLEDIPGTGKTMLLRAFARTVGSDFKRIQFTPDLVPSDLTGINFYNQKQGEFEFRLRIWFWQTRLIGLHRELSPVFWKPWKNIRLLWMG